MVESEWDALQQGWMVALAEYEASRCPGCGGDLNETLTTEAESYRVPPPARCGRCTRIAQAQEVHAKDHQHMHATRWTAHLRR